jgi:hypothetical protein
LLQKIEDYNLTKQKYFKYIQLYKKKKNQVKLNLKKKIEKENNMLIEKGNRMLTWFFMRIESLMWHASSDMACYFLFQFFFKYSLPPPPPPLHLYLSINTHIQLKFD